MSFQLSLLMWHFVFAPIHAAAHPRTKQIDTTDQPLGQEEHHQDKEETEYDEVGLSHSVGKYLRQDDEKDTSDYGSEKRPGTANDNREKRIERPRRTEDGVNMPEGETDVCVKATRQARKNSTDQERLDLALEHFHARYLGCLLIVPYCYHGEPHF